MGTKTDCSNEQRAACKPIAPCRSRGSRPAPPAEKAADGVPGPGGSGASLGCAALPLTVADVIVPTEERSPPPRFDLRAKGQAVCQQTSVNSRVFTAPRSMQVQGAGSHLRVRRRQDGDRGWGKERGLQADDSRTFALVMASAAA